ncbi:MAG: zinc-dependent peptidase [Aureliella sp.]|jgi:Mlc titration factor MtfA (ptsG expression regulator)
MFGWWTAARRRRLLSQSEPAGFRSQLSEGIWQWRFLPDDVADAAAAWARIFIAEKYWEGCGGFRLAPHHQSVIAGQASLMTLAFPNWFFNRCQTLLIYPSDYVAPGITHMVDGQTGVHGEQARSGQTSYRGPVILNWAAIEDAGRDSNDGQSLTVHELAHQMDFDNDPSGDGIPPLPASVDAQRWQDEFNDQLDDLRERTRYGGEVLVDDYGLSSPTEFFAVSSELFFQLPHELGEVHPELFDLLLAFYQRDWREWLPRWL